MILEMNIASGILLLLATAVSSQEPWVLDSCQCEANAPTGTIAKLQPITSWSPCEDWTEEDQGDIGCYSGRQRRTLRCTYVNVDGTSTPDLRQLNNRATNCEQYQRCLSQGRPCEGYWGQWSVISGPCDCEKMQRIQSRYCNKDLGNGQKSVVSKHCIGSKGHYEQNRTVTCTVRECPKLSTTTTTTTVSTIKSSKKTFKKPAPTKPEETTQIITETPTVATTENTTQEVHKSTETAQSGANVDIIIVAVSAAAVAFFAALMLLIMCCMRKNKPKDEIKNNNYDRPSSYIPPPHDITYMRNIHPQRAVRNSLYIPYDDDGEEHISPPPGYSTQPTPARQAVLERQMQNRRGRIVPLSQRDRSVTVGMVYPGYDTTMRDYRPNYNRIPRAQTFRDPPYQQPRDSLNNNEIYCTIDEIRPTGMLYGSHPDISTRPYRHSDSVFE